MHKVQNLVLRISYFIDKFATKNKITMIDGVNKKYSHAKVVLVPEYQFGCDTKGKFCTQRYISSL